MKVKIKPILRADLATKGEEKRIDLKVLCQGRYTKLSTPFHATPADWDAKNERIKSTSAYAIMANRNIKKKVADVEDLVLRRTLDGNVNRITIEEIRAVLSGESTPEAGARNLNAPIGEIFNLYIDYLKTFGKRQNTIVSYETHKHIICEFAKERYGRLVTVKNINLEFIRELRKHLQHDRNNCNGTIGKRLVGLRAVIRYAVHEGYTIDDPFNRYHNLIPKGESRTVFLDADEYRRFMRIGLPVSTKRSMKLSHTMFMFCCETGLRFSDMQDLKWSHLVEGDGGYEALEKHQIKTGNHVMVPLSDLAQNIITQMKQNRSGEYVFNRIEGQTVNRNLKLLMGIADINKDVSFHASRHTFASNLARNGANEFEVAQLLGDKDLDMARVYVNNDAKGLKQVMRKVWANQGEVMTKAVRSFPKRQCLKMA